MTDEAQPLGQQPASRDTQTEQAPAADEATNPTIRVAGLLTDGKRVLMVKQGRGEERYWLLPGGGVQFGETLSDALKRELREELGLRVGVGRLLAIVESISPDPTYRKHVVHLVFEISASPEALPEPQDDTVLKARFFDELELSRADVRPPIAEFLSDCLREVPSSPQYLGRRW
jgi:8-oxo-dGTP diphosphatase